MTPPKLVMTIFFAVLLQAVLRNHHHPVLGMVEARLEAALVLPHGDFAWDDNLLQEPAEAVQAAQEIAHAARQAGHWLQSQHQWHDGSSIRQEPNVIFLSTPHGIALERDFGIYLGSNRAAGSAHIGQDVPYTGIRTYDVAIDSVFINQTLSSDLLQFLLYTNATSPVANVTGMYLAPADADTKDALIPLFWGEVIPLLLLGTPKQKSQSVVILSHPHRRYDQAADMVPELLQLGRHIRQWMDSSAAVANVKFAVVVSGDLGHTHQADGPYGYAPEAALLDQALGEWAGGGGGGGGNVCSPSSQAALLDKARRYQAKGMSCGFTGMVLLHGMLCGDAGDAAAASGGPPRSATNNSKHRKNWSTESATAAIRRRRRISETKEQTGNDYWNSTVLVNRNVTYYGMMVAQFWRQNDNYYPGI